MIPLHDDNPTRNFPLFTILVIAANVMVFFFWQASTGLEQSVHLAAFTPSEFYSRGILKEGPYVFTSMFMHGGIMHLVSNMWFLWLFGNNIEDCCGKIRFVIFYLLCGIIATMVYAYFNRHSNIPLVGASGAISGVLGAYVITFPQARILTLLPLGIFIRTFYLPAWTFLGIWIGFQFLKQAAISGSHNHQQSGGVAFMAHIAGFLAGMIFIFFFRRNDWRRQRSSY